jgi:hypothetical protein
MLDEERVLASRNPLLSNLPQTEERYVVDIFRWGGNVTLQILFEGASRMGNWIQSGDVRRYLFYILIAFLVVLVILARS